MYNIFFFPYFQKNPREFLVTFTIWEMGLYKKECKLVLRCPFYTLAEQSQKARGRLKKEKTTHFFALENSPSISFDPLLPRDASQMAVFCFFVCFSTQLLVCSVFN